eukprot:gene35230-52830_t
MLSRFVWAACALTGVIMAIDDACRVAFHNAKAFVLRLLPCRVARFICGCSPHHFRAINNTPGILDRHGDAEVLIVKHLYHTFRTRVDPHTFLGVNTSVGLFRAERAWCFGGGGPRARRHPPHTRVEGARGGTRWCSVPDQGDVWRKPGWDWGCYEDKRPRAGWTLRETFDRWVNSSWTLTFNCWTLSRRAYDAVPGVSVRSPPHLR